MVLPKPPFNPMGGSVYPPKSGWSGFGPATSPPGASPPSESLVPSPGPASKAPLQRTPPALPFAPLPSPLAPPPPAVPLGAGHHGQPHRRGAPAPQRGEGHRPAPRHHLAGRQPPPPPARAVAWGGLHSRRAGRAKCTRFFEFIFSFFGWVLFLVLVCLFILFFSLSESVTNCRHFLRFFPC